LSPKIDMLHIRRSVKKIEQSIEELEKAKSVLLSLLPRSKVSASELIITLPGGKTINGNGEVLSGNQV
jgi:hypothetical protein